MPGFYGKDSVLRSLLYFQRTGKITTSGTLKKRTSGDTFGTTVAWGNLYVWPQQELTGLGADGYPNRQSSIVMWRINESYAPSPDDHLVIGADTYLILTVTTRLNADGGESYAVYDLTCTDGII